MQPQTGQCLTQCMSMARIKRDKLQHEVAHPITILLFKIKILLLSVQHAYHFNYQVWFPHAGIFTAQYNSQLSAVFNYRH